MSFNRSSVPVLCFVGTSNSGKTTLIEKIINLLTMHGYRVATVKHTHKEFAIDTEGKDSWRHRSAGAKTVILASPKQFFMVSDADLELTIEDVLYKYVNNIDILIVEGFKRDIYPKIEVYREGVSGELRCMNDSSIIAFVTDKSRDIPVPAFNINDAVGITNFIEQRILQQAGKFQNTHDSGG